MKIENHFTEIKINGYGVGAKVQYTYNKPSKGRRDGFGVPMEPDEAASVEIYSVSIVLDDSSFSFKEIDLPEIVLDDLADQILGEL